MMVEPVGIEPATHRFSVYRKSGVRVLMATYEDNAYNWLKRKGLAAKYEFAGIYCIKIDDEIVYVGKSGNMLRRIAQHYAGI